MLGTLSLTFWFLLSTAAVGAQPPDYWKGDGEEPIDEVVDVRPNDYDFNIGDDICLQLASERYSCCKGLIYLDFYGSTNCEAGTIYNSHTNQPIDLSLNKQSVVNMTKILADISEDGQAIIAQPNRHHVMRSYPNQGAKTTLFDKVTPLLGQLLDSQASAMHLENIISDHLLSMPSLVLDDEFGLPHITNNQISPHPSPPSSIHSYNNNQQVYPIAYSPIRQQGPHQPNWGQPSGGNIVDQIQITRPPVAVERVVNEMGRYFATRGFTTTVPPVVPTQANYIRNIPNIVYPNTMPLPMPQQPIQLYEVQDVTKRTPVVSLNNQPVEPSASERLLELEIAKGPEQHSQIVQQPSQPIVHYKPVPMAKPNKQRLTISIQHPNSLQQVQPPAGARRYRVFRRRPVVYKVQVPRQRRRRQFFRRRRVQYLVDPHPIPHSLPYLDAYRPSGPRFGLTFLG